MNSLILLTKVNLLSFFRNRNSNSKKTKSGIILFAFAFLYLAFYMYQLSNVMVKGYIQLNAAYLLLAQFMLISSIFILFTNIYKINGTLYNFKDYDLLMSLPIKRSVVITSKIIVLYIMSLMYALLFMIPAFVNYVTYVDVSFVFCILFFITLFIIPIFPIIIATIIGSVIAGISSRFKNKNVINYLLTVGLFVGLMVYSAKLENMELLDIANIGKSMVDIFNKVYPLTGMYLDIIKDSNLLSLILYLGISLIFFYTFIVIINKFYIKINNGLTSYKKNSKYKLTALNGSKPIYALYKKEFKRYISSIIYVMNTAFGALMLTICIIGIVLVGSDKINDLLDIPGFSSALIKIGPLIMGAFCVLNCSTHSSISLEGKNLWIIKSIPVNVKDIFLSKIMVNMTILIPTILINSTVLCIYLKTNLIMTLFMFITPFIYSVFISILGIVINLHFPNFTWKTEVKVIKQSMASFLALFVGMAIAIIPFTISYNFSNELYTVMITSIILIMTIGLYSYMNIKGVKIFNKLN